MSSQYKGEACRWMWIGSRNVNSSYLEASPSQPWPSFVSPLKKFFRQYTTIDTIRQEAYCASVRVSFFPLSFREQRPWHSHRQVFARRIHHITPKQATDYRLSAVTQPSPHWLLHFKMEKKKTPPWCLLIDWSHMAAAGSENVRGSAAQVDHWLQPRADERLASSTNSCRASGRTRSRGREVCWLQRPTLQLITDSYEWLNWKWGQMWKQRGTHRR